MSVELDISISVGRGPMEAFAKIVDNLDAKH